MGERIIRRETIGRDRVPYKSGRRSITLGYARITVANFKQPLMYFHYVLFRLLPILGGGERQASRHDLILRCIAVGTTTESTFCNALQKAF